MPSREPIHALYFHARQVVAVQHSCACASWESCLRVFIFKGLKAIYCIQHPLKCTCCRTELRFFKTNITYLKACHDRQLVQYCETLEIACLDYPRFPFCISRVLCSKSDNPQRQSAPCSLPFPFDMALESSANEEGGVLTKHFAFSLLLNLSEVSSLEAGEEDKK